MTAQKLLQCSEHLQQELQKWRRRIHEHPGTGFDIADTVEYVKACLSEMGYDPQPCGKAGLVALAGGKKPGKVFLLRADMDALPIKENSGELFASENGCMHACGHDMHTAMLLGAAYLLKEHEEELEGTVKLLFQPAEEIFQGALDVIEAGVLENPKVDAAMMIHVAVNAAVPAGSVLVSGGGISTTACEQYHITVHGKGGHGSMPHLAVDPLTAAAHIHLALQEISSRELDPNRFGVFTTGKFQAGVTSNVIPDTAEMWGTIRTADPGGETGAYIKRRILEIAKGVGAALRCTVKVEFSDFCPCMLVDKDLSNDVMGYMTELMGESAQLVSARGGGSEDFAFISQKVPAVGIYLAVGDGNGYGLHHPKVRFDDTVMWRGSAVYCYNALRWLKEHKNDFS